MRLVTWNVYFGGHMADERNAALVDELLRRRPDVIALQEVTPELLWRLKPLAHAGYWMSDVDGDTVDPYGVLVMSRLEVGGCRFHDLPTEMSRRLVMVDLACGLTVASVHLESGDDGAPLRLAQLAVIQPRLARPADVVWVGDMNFEPGTTAEEAALDPAFVDVWPALHRGDPGYTVDTDVNTMRYQLKSKPTHKRIDRVFLRSTRWRPRAIERVGTAPIDIDGTFVSDHFGLEVDLA